jgi:anthranilate phosphoribosyltransferase
VIGAWSEEVAEQIARCLAGLPLERAFVVHGAPGWDEPTPCGPFLLADVRPGNVAVEHCDPEEFGLSRCAPDALRGGDAAHNAHALRAALSGEEGPHRDALSLGAALALEVTGQADGLAEGLERARAAIDAGDAARLLERLARFGARGAGSARTGTRG